MIEAFFKLSIFSNKKKVAANEKTVKTKILKGAKPKLPMHPNKKLIRR